ncbi:MAG TPA: hypothetical protein VI757_13080 [Bacteroidia bacterium]|nr:hypothetical protein [Bacteroidia bacterium]
MRNRKVALIFLFTAFAVKSFSAGSDSTGSAVSKKIFFSIDYRNSFITSTEAHVIGFRAGLELNNKFRLGAGYHFLNSEIVKTISIDNTITNAQVRLRYGSMSVEFVLLSKTLWQLTAPLILGFGQSAYIPPSNDYGITEKHFAIFVEPAVTFQYNVIPFIGIGTGIGYRFMPAGDSTLRSSFETPVYDFRIKILIDEVLDALFPGK